MFLHMTFKIYLCRSLFIAKAIYRKKVHLIFLSARLGIMASQQIAFVTPSYYGYTSSHNATVQYSSSFENNVSFYFHCFQNLTKWHVIDVKMFPK